MTDVNVGTEKARNKNQNKQESESMLSLRHWLRVEIQEGNTSEDGGGVRKTCKKCIFFGHIE